MLLRPPPARTAKDDEITTLTLGTTAPPAPETSTPQSPNTTGPDHPVDPDVMANLYASSHDALFAHARRLLRNPADAEDLVHDAFVRALSAAPRTGIANPMQPWTTPRSMVYLRQVVTNLCLDRYRVLQRRPTPVHLDVLPEDVLPVFTQPDRVEQAETAAEVHTALRLLPPAQRDALVLKEVHEADTDEIAQTLQIDKRNVKHVLGRARKGLRTRLEALRLHEAA